jgi:hypothetical protein
MPKNIDQGGAAMPLQIRSLHADPNFAAEASGIDVRTPLTPEQVAAIYQDNAIAIRLGALLLVISAMVVVAYASGGAFAIVGATLFYVSDALIGWTRFVKPIPRGRLVIMVTYHLGQAGLVLSLAG